MRKTGSKFRCNIPTREGRSIFTLCDGSKFLTLIYLHIDSFGCNLLVLMIVCGQKEIQSSLKVLKLWIYNITVLEKS